MNPESQIIVAPGIPPAPITIAPEAIALKEAALEGSALIGKVTNAEQNEAASKAQARLKSVFRLFENSRVKMKEPALEYGRAVDRAVAPHKDELDRENGRIAELVSEFKLAERRRIQEEERLQAAELARIEAEKQAELKRIADEQARIEREAREAKEKAEQMAREATTKMEKNKAEEARIESERLRKESEAKAAEAAKSVAAVESKAGEAAYLESRPIIATKACGQSEREDWEVQIVNPYDLAKFHPDCVTITPLMGKIKGMLNEGREMRGVKAKIILVTNQRAEKSALIEV